MGKYRSFGTFFDRVFRNDLNANFNDVDTDIQSQKKRVDDLIVGNPQPSEVVDARGGFPVLRDRLDDVASQMAEKALQSDLNTTSAKVTDLENKKADKTEVDLKISQIQSGVKGTYATLSNLQSAFPSGDSGNYVLQSDGRIYNWNGTSWADTGIQYQSSGIARGSVTEFNTDFLDIKENRFKGDYNTILTISSNESLNEVYSTGDGTTRTAIVELKSGEPISIKVTGEHNRFLIGLTNALIVGQPLERLLHDTTGSNSEFSFNNTNNYKYLMVTVSSTSQEPALIIYPDSTIPSDVDQRKVMIKNKSIVLRDEPLYQKLSNVPSQIGTTTIKDLSNLFNGIYNNEITISTNESLNEVYSTGDGKTRAVVIQLKSDSSYTIKVLGEHDRFIVGLANYITVGSPLKRIHHETSATNNYNNFTEHEFTFINDESHKYLLVAISSTQQEPETKVYNSDSVPNKTGIFINDKLIPTENPEKYAKYYKAYDIEGGVPALHTELYNMYDDLMSQNPTYITKQVLGQDAQGNNLVEYLFKQPNTTNNMGFEKIKIGLLSGLHGTEKNPAKGAYHFLKALTENEHNNETFNKVKSFIDFYIIPVGNPTGWDANTRNNWNNVDLNRNFDINWETVTATDKGSSPASESETTLIQGWAQSNQFDYFIDLHNDAQVEDRINYIYVQSGSIGEVEIKKHYWKTSTELSVQWSERFADFPKGIMYGLVPAGPDFSGFAFNYASSKGSIACLLETAWGIIYTGGVWNAKEANLCATELFGNLVLRITEEYI